MMNICLTFDYEIFFGKNFYGSQEVLFEPTNLLLKTLNDNNVRATFFVDTCSAIRCKELEINDYISGFNHQIVQMNHDGHDVQLHIHPHWLVSNFVDDEWKFDSNFYRIHSFGFDYKKSNNAHSIIKQSIQYLNDIIKADDPTYKCIAYRAGGFSIQPHCSLTKMLVEEGIKVDSSIAPGLCSKSATNYYDFTGAPKGNWYISDSKPLFENANSITDSLYEIPIGTTKNNGFSYALKKIMSSHSLKLDLGKKRGTYINETEKSNKLQLVIDFLRGYSSISMDAYRAEYIYCQLKRYYKKFKGTTLNIAVIGHPKLVTQGYTENLVELIQFINKDPEMQFCTISGAYERRNINDSSSKNGKRTSAMHI